MDQLLHKSAASSSPPLHPRAIGRRQQLAHAPTPPPSPRRVPRLGVLALFSVITVYAVCFLVWGVWLSDGLADVAVAAPLHLHVFSDTGNSDDVKLSSRLLRQLRLRRGETLGTRDTGRNRADELDTGSRPPDLHCLGWKQTDNCDPDAPVTHNRNRTCDQFVRGGVSGYCLMQNEASGELVRVMRVSCESLRPDVVFSCRHAGDFADFRFEVEHLSATLQREQKQQQAAASASDTGTSLTVTKETIAATSETRSKGILMVMYPKLLVSAYASIRALRAVNCTLPVELWYLESEMGSGSNVSREDAIPTRLQREFRPLTLHAITDPDVAGFNSKVYAVMHTKLEHVLFLDADNVPVKDPSFLFSTPEFVQTGAVFWPDFWHPLHSIFNINGDSLLWELLDMPYVDMFEQESGQLVIDKTRSASALRMLALFAFHDPNLFSRYKLAHGDKDLFRLAWLKTQTPFHMIASPPGIAGTVREDKFCGMSMVQFDPRGEVLFLHRNAEKLTGGLGSKHKPDRQIWTHLQRFRYRAASPHDLETEAAFEALKPTHPPDVRIGSPLVPLGNLALPYEVLRQRYTVNIFNGAPEFEETQWCYGQASLHAPRYKTVPWEDTPFSEVERDLLRYAAEAVALLPESTTSDVH
ncbi:hypothetical protein BBJ28_00024534 [Nothophytophthora sp. Chile5]|nr:hypothetical protein BBJ28_00024534 [Nothophytophthora sp. Chile5]